MLSRKRTPRQDFPRFSDLTEGVLRDHPTARNDPNHPLFSCGGSALHENFGGGRPPARGAPPAGSGAPITHWVVSLSPIHGAKSITYLAPTSLAAGSRFDESREPSQRSACRVPSDVLI
jgi:hypothetical protein